MPHRARRSHQALKKVLTKVSGVTAPPPPLAEPPPVAVPPPLAEPPPVAMPPPTPDGLHKPAPQVCPMEQTAQVAALVPQALY